MHTMLAPEATVVAGYAAHRWRRMHMCMHACGSHPDSMLRLRAASNPHVDCTRGQNQSAKPAFHRKTSGSNTMGEQRTCKDKHAKKLTEQAEQERLVVGVPYARVCPRAVVVLPRAGGTQIDVSGGWGGTRVDKEGVR